MAKYIEAYKGDTLVFLNLDQTQRIGLTKSDALKQSEREAKVVFADGSKGEYVVHRKVIKQLASTINAVTEEAAE